MYGAPWFGDFLGTQTCKEGVSVTSAAVSPEHGRRAGRDILLLLQLRASRVTSDFTRLTLGLLVFPFTKYSEARISRQGGNTMN